MPSFRLTPALPFRLDLTSWVLRRRPNNTWDFWDGETYRRVLVIEGKPVDVSTRQYRHELEVTLSGIRISPQVREQIGTALKRLLGLDVDLSAF